MRMRCYCCGETLESRVALVTLRKPEELVDVVFLMKPEHVDRVDHEPQSEVIERERADNRIN